MSKIVDLYNFKWILREWSLYLFIQQINFILWLMKQIPGLNLGNLVQGMK